jgi:alpha-amylase
LNIEAQRNDRVVLQAFYWDYNNENYPQGWANYITELAPRLREMGIDAVWVPPSFKNANPLSVGYSPFDHYDLGDKFQKGNLKTPFGDKDEFLRMVAVLHSNGIEVIQDITLNHVSDAGNTGGAGGQDPVAQSQYNDFETDGFKNFRYVCYETPYGDNSSFNYLNRKGRWPKNYQNFYPNPNHSCCSNEINSVYWGPDIAYEFNSVGQSSCTSCYNPPQSNNYMRNEARKWFLWYKKQTGVDGYRFDAVKHFSADVVEDLLWNAQNNAGFAAGGQDMFAVGEYVGNSFEMDNWANATQNRAGTFDFSLRGSIRNMVYSFGGYDLSNIPGSQQSNRIRTVPFVNSHDTFRPQVDENGAYDTWDTFNELGGHIDPNEPRLSAAYAIAMAVDGSPLIFMEDLFVMDTPERFTHDPRSETELPLRDDIRNIIYCHQKLKFKDGAYKVRHGSSDHLIIERSGKAIIGINDSWETWQNQWIPTDFAPGTELKDYSGANSDNIFVNQDGWIQVWTPPCNGSNIRRGYTIWGPAGLSGPVTKKGFATNQEWHMTNDLGDSHPLSLQQGGSLPNFSTATRTAGTFFNRPGRMRAKVFPTNPLNSITLILADATGENHLDSISGTGVLTKIWTTPSAGWYTLKVRNTTDEQIGQECKVRITYGTPRVVNTSAFTKSNDIKDKVKKVNTELKLSPNPVQDILDLRFEPVGEDAWVRIFDINGRLVMTTPLFNGSSGLGRISVQDLDQGTYLLEILSDGKSVTERFVKY